MKLWRQNQHQAPCTWRPWAFHARPQPWCLPLTPSMDGAGVRALQMDCNRQESFILMGTPGPPTGPREHHTGTGRWSLLPLPSQRRSRIQPEVGTVIRGVRPLDTPRNPITGTGEEAVPAPQLLRDTCPLLPASRLYTKVGFPARHPELFPLHSCP